MSLARTDRTLDKAIEVLEERVAGERVPVLYWMNDAKLQTLTAIREGETDPEIVEQNTSAMLRKDMDLISFVKVQSARNAASWARGDLDQI